MWGVSEEGGTAVASGKKKEKGGPCGLLSWWSTSQLTRQKQRKGGKRTPHKRPGPRRSSFEELGVSVFKGSESLV